MNTHQNALRKTLSLGLLLLCLAAMPAASANPTPSLSELFKAAGEARKAGDLPKAIELLKKCYALQPSPNLLNNLGKLYEELGWYRKAADAYKKVADDPKAPLSLRSLDETRLAKLAPKLRKAWLALKLTPQETKVYVDGAEQSDWQVSEFGVRAGKRHLEFRGQDASKTTLMAVTLPLARRTTVTFDLTGPQPKDNGTLALEGDLTQLASLTVNQVPLAQPLTGLKTISLPAGKVKLTMKFQSGSTVVRTVDLAPGKTAPVSIKAPSIPKPVAPKSALKPVKTKPNILAWTIMGAGVLVAGTGTALFLTGGGKVDALNDALSTGTTVTQYSQSEAQALRDEANGLATGGAVAMSLGVAAVLTGLVLYFVKPSKTRTIETSVKTPVTIAPGLDGSVHVHIGF